MQPANHASGKRHSWDTLVWVVAVLFFVATTSFSWLRWANFQYRTFDLAYYVQAVWQLIHGRFQVSVENVPLLGNHVEPIVLLFAPLFAVIRHPMVFVVVQNAALALTAPIGYRLARRFFDARTAALLAIAILITPAAGYIALHEFHPEALTAPLLLLMVYTRVSRRLWLHWVCFIAVLACKENMALLLIAYGIVFLVVERRSPRAELIPWYGAPLLLAMIWFALCTKVITPVFNSGNIDYLSLYDRLGKSAPEIIWNAITKPQLIGRALLQSLSHGNLVWGLLLPFLGLPLLRPRWLLISAPILLQHLLSWRSSEWNIYFHYAAPLLPLFWIGAIDALVMLRGKTQTANHARPAMEDGAPATPLPVSAPPRGLAGARPSIPFLAAILLLVACLAAQVWMGPSRAIASELSNRRKLASDRVRKQEFIEKIPTTASVAAPLPYLSHLAMREKLYSLHYILKGLKTLSRERFAPPPPPDYVLIDYDDAATFDAGAGYYHPQMRTADGQVIPSSDRLLNEFLGAASWTADSRDELALFKRTAADERGRESLATPNQDGSARAGSVFAVGGNELRDISRSEVEDTGRAAGNDLLEVDLQWSVNGERETFPWMTLRLTTPGKAAARTLTRGLCAIDARQGNVTEHWRTALPSLPPGEYDVEVIFVDNAKRAWLAAHGGGEWRSTLLAQPIPLGKIIVPRSAQ